MTAVPFSKQSPAALVFDKASKRCVGWGAFSKKDWVEYDDAHGDHFPDDEFFKAVGGLMKRDYVDREINVEHLGAAQGSIVTAWAMGEDIAKALKIDTGGNYGVLLDFEPGPELLAKMEAGEMFCLSMEGLARNVQTVAKSAGADIAAAKRKRVMRGVELYKWAVCKAGAHDGAEVALIKTAVPSAAALTAARARVAKATPAFTTADYGHQHLIADIDEPTGCTSSEQMAGQPNDGWHSHLWGRDASGAVVILMALGHTHNLATSTAESGGTSTPIMESAPMAQPTDLEKSQAVRITTLGTLLLACAALPPDQLAFAKTLPADRLESFLGKSDDERAAAAKPLYKSERTGRAFYKGQDELAELAKGSDEQAVEIAKAKARERAASFAKRAGEEIPNLRGTVAERGALLEAVDGIADEAVRKSVVESLKGANASLGELFKTKGVNATDQVVTDADAIYAAKLEAFAKTRNKTPDDAAPEFLASPEGQQAYAEHRAAAGNRSGR